MLTIYRHSDLKFGPPETVRATGMVPLQALEGFRLDLNFIDEIYGMGIRLLLKFRTKVSSTSTKIMSGLVIGSIFLFPSQSLFDCHPGQPL